MMRTVDSGTLVPELVGFFDFSAASDEIISAMTILVNLKKTRTIFGKSMDFDTLGRLWPLLHKAG
jgi:hypothetical protein